jgi:hypothetical protein
MGASSVTGVGQGSADKIGQKGSEHMHLDAGNLIGPHIVASGTATLSSGTKALHIPLLPGVAADYVVVGGNQTNANAWKCVITLGTDTTLTFTGTGSDVIGYAVVKTGLA